MSGSKHCRPVEFEKFEPKKKNLRGTLVGTEMFVARASDRQAIIIGRAPASH
jgi:hypothetical protein